MSRKREVVPLAEVLAEVMAQPAFRRGSRLKRIDEALARVLPPALADGVQAHRLEGGVLWISVPSPAQVQELALSAPAVCGALAAEGVKVASIKPRLRS